MTDATEKRGAALPEAADRRNQETRLADKRKARSAPSRSERSQLASALLPLGSPVTPAEYELSPGGGRGRRHGSPPRTGMTRSGSAFPRAALVGAPVGVPPLARGRPASAPPPLLPMRPRPPARHGGHNQYRTFLGREGISTPGVVDVDVRLPVRNTSWWLVSQAGLAPSASPSSGSSRAPGCAPGRGPGVGGRSGEAPAGSGVSRRMALFAAWHSGRKLREPREMDSLKNKPGMARVREVSGHHRPLIGCAVPLGASGPSAGCEGRLRLTKSRGEVRSLTRAL